MDELFKDGCLWVVGTSSTGFGAKKTTHKVFCNKLRDQDSVYCPKHKLFQAEEEQEKALFPLRMRAARQLKKARLEELANSPLAAINPRFDKPKKHGGMDAEEK